MLDLAPQTESLVQEYAARAGVNADEAISRLIKAAVTSPRPTNDADDTEQKILLSERDFARFVELIDNPPPPTDALRKAMTEYQRLKATHPEANL